MCSSAKVKWVQMDTKGTISEQCCMGVDQLICAFINSCLLLIPFVFCFCFLQRHNPFDRVSKDSFLVDPGYPTLSLRKNVLPVCWMKDTRWTKSTSTSQRHSTPLTIGSFSLSWSLPASMEPCWIGLNRTCQIVHARSKSTACRVVNYWNRLPFAVAPVPDQLAIQKHYVAV